MERELASYEGLVFRTAQMYAPMVDDDEEDVRQFLRITVWKALSGYKRAGREIPDANGRTPRDRYVFVCVTNRVKDLLKKKKRPEDFIEDKAPDPVRRERFDALHLAVDESAYVEAIIDGDVVLPSTLNLMEIQVVRLLLQDFNQTEIARHLGVTRTKVREAHASVKVKMADWGTDEGAREEARLSLAA